MPTGCKRWPVKNSFIKRKAQPVTNPGLRLSAFLFEKPYLRAPKIAKDLSMQQLSDFGIIFLFIIGALAFVALTLGLAWLIRPSRPNVEKLSSYECGEEPEVSATGQFNLRFYIIALVFILFDVEIIFLFPWATVFGQRDLIEQTGGLWGWFALTEMFLFVGILILGLAYAWVKGHLDWVKPEVKIPVFYSKVPKNLYQQINERQYPLRKQPENISNITH
jgi:NADH-quinone oxidoreductase subunit A